MTDNEKSYVRGLGTQAAGLAGYIFLADIISLIVAGLSLAVVARILGPSIYGVYTVAIAVTSLLILVSNPGTAAALSKLIAQYSTTKDRRRTSEALSNAVSVTLLLGGVLAFATFAASPFISSYALHTAQYSYVIQAASLLILLSAMHSVLVNALVGFSDGRASGLVTATQIIAQSLMSMALAIAGLGALAPVLGLVFGYASSIILSSYFLLHAKRIRLVAPSADGVRSVMSLALPIGASGVVSSVVPYVLPIVLATLATTTVVGNYGVASRSGSFISTMIAAIAISLLPAFTAAITRMRSKARIASVYNYSIYVTFVILAPVMFTVALLSKQVTLTLFSGKYLSASPYIAIVSLGILLSMIGLYTVNLLIGGGKVKEVLRSNAALMVIQLISMLALVVLIPTFKGLGAIVVMFVITPIALILLFTRAAERTLGVRLDLRGLYRVAIAAAASTALIIPLIFLLGGSYVALLIAAAIEQLIAYPPILALARGISKADIKSLKRITASLPVANWAIARLANYSGRFIGH